MESKIYDTIILGAGPAGLMAAAQIKNRQVLVLEKGNTPGKKLLISGSGRCNYTHEGEIKEFLLRYGAQGKFLKHALYQFDNKKCIQFFADYGLESVADKNGKIFPSTDQAKDVLAVLMNTSRMNGVVFKFDQVVKNITKIDDLFLIETEHETYQSHSLLVATGGRSYPKTGSTGDGYTIAEAFGHSIIPTKPALTSLLFPNFEFVNLSGIAIYDRQISLFRNGKKLHEYRGDIGFTHKGLSGPGILDFSRYFEIGDVLKINLCNIPSDELRMKLIEEGKNSGKTQIKNFLKRFDIPESLVLQLLQKIEVAEQTTMATLTKEERKRVVEKFCELSIIIEQVAGFSQAMATAGGVNLDEINPKSMESKLTKNLFFAGEILDIDADTGGYNIQAAFSMGNLVAKTIHNNEPF